MLRNYDLSECEVSPCVQMLRTLNRCEVSIFAQWVCSHYSVGTSYLPTSFDGLAEALNKVVKTESEQLEMRRLMVYFKCVVMPKLKLN